jgi:GNAT superfamily N-acetyltransferase
MRYGGTRRSEHHDQDGEFAKPLGTASRRRSLNGSVWPHGFAPSYCRLAPRGIMRSTNSVHNPWPVRYPGRGNVSFRHSSVTVRSATEADLNEIADMVQGFVVGHPAEFHPRPVTRLREAYFGAAPVAHLLVARKGPHIVGMGQWTRMYDMFWAMFGGDVEWLYVRPEARGLGIPAAIIAEICRQVRLEGGELLRGGADGDAIAALYERVAIGWRVSTGALSGEAFQICADLAGLSPREIVTSLPAPELNRTPALPRETACNP